MKVTKATIKKAIKELGLNVENFEIHGSSKYTDASIESTRIKDERGTKKGNAEVTKVAKHLAKAGASYYGYMTGYNNWILKFGYESYSSKLARMNID